MNINFTCPRCSVQIPLRVTDFPFHCACGTKYTAADAVLAAPPPLTGPELHTLLSRNHLQELEAAATAHGLLIGDLAAEVSAALGRPARGPVAHAKWVQRYRQWFGERFNRAAA